MTKIYFFLLIIFFAFSVLSQEQQIVFGQKVDHPYGWMEDVTSDTVQNWLTYQQENQSEVFKRSDFKKLNSVLYAPKNSYIRKTNRYKFDLVVASKAPPRLKYYVLGKEEEFGILIKCQDFKRSKNDYPSITNYWITDSELFLVAAVSHSGSDWKELLVYDLESKQLIDKLEGVIRSRVIFHGRGFYYERYDPPTELKSLRSNQRIAFHEFNTPQSSDKNIFVNADSKSIRQFEFAQIEDTKSILVFHPIRIKSAWKRAITKIELGDFSPLRPFFVYSSPYRITFDPIVQHGDSVLMRTDLRDPNFEVLKFNTRKINQYTSFLAANELVLKDVTMLNDQYYGLKYHSEGRYLGIIVDEVGKMKLKVPTYEGSSIEFISGEEGSEAYCLHNHYLSERNVETIDLNNLTTDFRSNTYISYFGRNRTVNWEAELTNFQSKDGVNVPITILYNKDTFKKNGDQPLLIKVYGGYGLDQEPSFSWESRLFVKNGGVLVFPGIRGSSARGADWALAGRGLKKQKTIDDVIAAAEYLIKKKYVRSGNIFLEGGSHGGFLVAAAGIQRPDLFKGVIAKAGIFDLVNFTVQSIGNLEINREEFGDPLDSATFINRLNLSPIHTLRKGEKYPSFLIITGSNDTRVAPSQSYRFMALLKEYSANSQNFIHVTNGGHGIANFPKEQLEIISLKFKFLWLHTGYKFWKG
ncbi:MAG: prolyl oligopeptidase family serine peptidase [Cytophagales bacterium]|nr:prolyl oligopeptidase family serine peptidase [Cytophagales bacterium]